jgi:hypothetical protein
MKLSSNGAPIWCRANGGSGTVESTGGVAVDVAGNVFVSGTFHQTFGFDKAHQASCPGCDGALWIAKLDP